jgi:competence protein ComEC
LIGTSTLFNKLKASKSKINVISSIVLIVLMFITGFTPSVVRACIMAELGIFAKMLNRKSDILNNLCIALLITLIHNPYNLVSNSVLLSYGGVFRNNLFF